MARPLSRTPRRTIFGSTWWGRAWVEALEHRARLDPNRLPRGRSYARWNMVSRLAVDRGEVRAAVQGSRAQPYVVRVRVRQFGDDEWEQVFAAIASRAANAAALLDGELEPGVAEAAAAAGVDLLPGAGELQPRCSCPDWADPCKHSAAVCYLVADQLDTDPFALFLLRGRDREQVMAGVRHQRAGAVASSGDLASSSHLARPVDAGVSARAAFDQARVRPPLPVFSRPPHEVPHVPPLASDPPSGLAPPAADLMAVALDASHRARELLWGDGSSGLELNEEEDLARRAAGMLGGRDGDLERLAARAGLRPRQLGRLAVAWRHGGQVAVALVTTGPTWTVAEELLHAGRAQLIEAGVPAAKIKLEPGALTLVGQRARLCSGPDGQWYRVERKAAGAEVTRPPSDDPADLIVD